MIKIENMSMADLLTYKQAADYLFDYYSNNYIANNMSNIVNPNPIKDPNCQKYFKLTQKITKEIEKRLIDLC